MKISDAKNFTHPVGDKKHSTVQTENQSFEKQYPLSQLDTLEASDANHFFNSTASKISTVPETRANKYTSVLDVLLDPDIAASTKFTMQVRSCNAEESPTIWHRNVHPQTMGSQTNAITIPETMFPKVEFSQGNAHFYSGTQGPLYAHIDTQNSIIKIQRKTNSFQFIDFPPIKKLAVSPSGILAGISTKDTKHQEVVGTLSFYQPDKNMVSHKDLPGNVTQLCYLEPQTFAFVVEDRMPVNVVDSMQPCNQALYKCSTNGLPMKMFDLPKKIIRSPRFLKNSRVLIMKAHPDTENHFPLVQVYDIKGTLLWERELPNHMELQPIEDQQGRLHFIDTETRYRITYDLNGIILFHGDTQLIKAERSFYNPYSEQFICLSHSLTNPYIRAVDLHGNEVWRIDDDDNRRMDFRGIGVNPNGEVYIRHGFKPKYVTAIDKQGHILWTYKSHDISCEVPQVDPSGHLLISEHNNIYILQ